MINLCERLFLQGSKFWRFVSTVAAPTKDVEENKIWINDLLITKIYTKHLLLEL